MLSVALHLCLLLLVILWLNRPRPLPEEQFIVLDLGTPQQAEDTVNAPTVEDPAPQAPTPQVADDDTGEPQAQTAEQTETVAPDPDPVTQQPEPQPAVQPDAQSEAQSQTEPEPADQPEEAAVPAESEPEPAVAEAEGEEPPEAPIPEVREPAPEASVPDLPVTETASVLPEIDEAQIEPSQADQAIDIPRPQTAARVPQVRNVAVEAGVQVSAAEEIPQPEVSANTPQSREVPQPQVQAQASAPVPVPRPEAAASVAASVTVPRPQASSEVAAPQEIPQPAVSSQVAEQQAIPEPEASSQVAQPQAIPQPQATASTAEASEIPAPQASAQVASSRSVPSPNASAQVASARPVPMPGIDTEVAQSRSVEVSAQVAVSRSVPVPSPQISARVTAPQPEPGAAMAGAAPTGSSDNPSNRTDDRIPGGNANQGAQDRVDEDAQAGNLGRAASPDEGDATGAQSLRPRIPYREERDRPLAVLLDNAAGYPQSGLASASVITEMPVEGGLTRLMTLYDLRDPGQVGPIRSARDYFVELARGYDGVLVHDGGSPAAMAAISRNGVNTLNAYQEGTLFARQGQAAAPYNLYSSGSSLREAVNRLRLDRLVELTGVVPQPPEEAPDATAVEVRFSGDYRSGFSYIRPLDRYRWHRNGEGAVDASGDAVTVEAVLVARIDARPIPDDPYGRLYIPLRGGGATLYLRGKAIDGRWSLGGEQGNGVVFESADGEEIDITPFRTWITFAPQNAIVAQN